MDRRGCFGIINIVGVLLFLLASVGWVHAEFSEPFTYVVNTSWIQITDCDQSASGALVVPAELEGKPVTSIDDRAFSYCRYLTSITLPDSIVAIGDFAFASCDALNSIIVGEGNSHYSSIDGVLFNKAEIVLVQCPGGKAGVYTIPGSVNTVAEQAFAYCDHLTGILIHSGIDTIGEYAFRDCQSLEAITVDVGNSKFGSVDGVLFNKILSTLIQCPGGKTGAYTLPGSVAIIDDYAFYYCDRLTSITLPNGLNSIGD